MKTAIYILLFLIFGVNMLLAQNEIYTDSLGKKILVGTFSWDDWQKEMNWKLDSAFKLDAAKAGELEKICKEKEITFKIFAGSWCGDTRSELPKIMEIFSNSGISANLFTLLGVDRKKFEPSFAFAENQIEKVPTLIILSTGKEIGRIIEFPHVDWLTDIIKIINEN
jgi:thiol-disulfide isomerase/thioredoxin